jgi:hypothetical protein
LIHGQPEVVGDVVVVFACVVVLPDGARTDAANCRAAVAEVRVDVNWRRLVVMRAPPSGEVTFPGDSLQERIRRR